jgi:glucokinase
MQKRRRRYVGLDIGGTNIKSALVCTGTIEERTKLPTQARTGVKGVLAQIKAAIDPFVNDASGIGIGVAGIIDSKKGIVRFSPNLPGWNNIRLADILTREFNVQVRVLNDVNAFCLGEWQYGAARGYDNVFLFTLGTGVGGAAICEGKPLFGAAGFAGEFGHSVIKYNGPACPCGNRGCLERYVGARYIVARAKRKLRKKKSILTTYKNLTPRVIADEAKKGDAVAREVFEETGFYIGIGVTNIIALFDPDVVVISGGVSRAGRVLFDPIRTTVRQRVLGAQYRKTKIIRAQRGDDGGILGAVYFASRRAL